MSTYDKKYYQGIDHFNNREFFDAHEIWEDLWNEEHGEAKEFVQGLIQFATCLHHFEASNMKGAKILFESGVELLEPYGEVYWNLPVKKLIDDMRECVRGLLPFEQKDLPGRYHPEKKNFQVQIEDQKVPKISLKE